MLVGNLGTFLHMQKYLVIKTYQLNFIHFPNNLNLLGFSPKANHLNSNFPVSKNNTKLSME